MARPKGPEEFFEVLRSAQRGKEPKPAAAGAPKSVDRPPIAPEAGGEASREAGGERAGVTEAPRGGAASAPSPPSTPATSQAAAQRRFPFSVFTESEPTVTLRRSTLVFAVVVGVILISVAYGIGRRVGRGAPARSRTLPSPGGMMETRVPALPAELRGKCAVVAKVFDHTQEANPANARAYRDFLSNYLRTAADAAALRAGGKSAFILSYARELAVCVGPFDRPDSLDAVAAQAKLRTLRFRNVLQFADASVERLRADAKLFE